MNERPRAPFLGVERSPSPQVAVIIPTRDRWETLERLGLPTALSQTGVELEVVVVDDGSTKAWEQRPKLNDPRVEVVTHRSNRGLSAARNTGIQRSSAPWVAFLDDDDLWAPGKLTTMIAAAERSGSDFVYSRVVFVDRDLRPRWIARPSAPDRLLADLHRANALIAGGSNVVVRRSALIATGGFDEELSVAADWDMWLRLAGTCRATMVEAPLIAYRASSWVLDDEAAHNSDLERLRDKHGLDALDLSSYERWIADSMYQSGRRGQALGRYLATAIRQRDLKSLAGAISTAMPSSALDRLRRRGSHVDVDWLERYRS